MNKNTLLLLPAAGLTQACASSKNSSARQNISLRATTRTNTVPDTINIVLPQHSLERTAPAGDSLSTLTCPAATSTARINPDGSITHSLRTNTGPIPVPLLATTVQTDTIALYDTAVSHTEQTRQPFHISPWHLCITALIAVIIIKCR